MAKIKQVFLVSGYDKLYKNDVILGVYTKMKLAENRLQELIDQREEEDSPIVKCYISEVNVNCDYEIVL